MQPYEDAARSQRWSMPVDALMMGDYEYRETALTNLYHKAKAAQWTSTATSTGT